MTEVKNRAIACDVIKHAYTYEEYRELVEKNLKQGKTTGENHSEAMLHNTNMNVHRMNRHDKRTELRDDIILKMKDVKEKWIWLVLTEAWSGDAGHSIPIINKMARMNENIELRFILRDQNLAVMDQFLQNGISRSIPKLICLNADTLEVLGEWGPRPQKVQDMYDSMQNSTGITNQEVTEHLHKWYADDKGDEIQKEFIYAIDEWIRG